MLVSVDTEGCGGQTGPGFGGPGAASKLYRTAPINSHKSIGLSILDIADFADAPHEAD